MFFYSFECDIVQEVNVISYDFRLTLKNDK